MVGWYRERRGSSAYPVAGQVYRVEGHCIGGLRSVVLKRKNICTIAARRKSNYPRVYLQNTKAELSEVKCGEQQVTYLGLYDGWGFPF